MTLKQNDPAPDFDLTADDGSRVRLSELRGRRVVIYFYPRADTPGCTTESCEFQALAPDIEGRGAVILGISPDPVEDVRKFREKYGFPFRLLADPDHRAAEAYGVWKEKTNFGKTYWGVERSTFVVDEQGRIARAYRRVRPEGHAARVLQEL